MADFSIGSDRVRVAATTFSDGAKIEFDFTEVDQTTSTAEAGNHILEKLHQISTNVPDMNLRTDTDIASGLGQFRQELYASTSRAHRGVPLYAVVLSDGIARPKNYAKILKSELTNHTYRADDVNLFIFPGGSNVFKKRPEW